MRRLVTLVLCAFVPALPIVLRGSAVQAADPPPPRPVSLVGDSTMAAMVWSRYDNADPDTLANNDIREIISSRYPLTFSAESCRRLVIASCRGRFGSTPISTLPLITRQLYGQLGDVMVVMAGYDDVSISPAIDQIVNAATAQGVMRVMWLTYPAGTKYRLPDGSAASVLYDSHNRALADAARRLPALELLDWGNYSHNQPGWFASDGIHLSIDGAVGLATYIRDALDRDPALQRCPAAATDAAPTPSGQVPDQAALSDLGMVALAPTRAIDTRVATAGRPASMLAAGGVLPVDLGGIIDGAATSVAVTVTAVTPCRAGYAVVYDCGTRPGVSNVNYEPFRTTAASVITAVDAGRRICISTSAAADFIVDVVGELTPSGEPFHPSEARLLDTRTVAGPQLRAGEEITVAASVPAGARAAWVNLTAVDPQGDTVLVTYPGPCGRPPSTSSINTTAGQTRSIAVITGLGDDRTICVRVHAGEADVVVDLVGWFGDGGADAGYSYSAVPPQRLLDTREGGGGPVQRAEVAAGDVSILGLTSTGTVAAGYFAVGCDGRADTSVSNIIANVDVANATVATLEDGKVCVTSSAPTHIVVDLLGVFRPRTVN